MERCNWLKEMLKQSECNLRLVLFRWNSRENDQIRTDHKLGCIEAFLKTKEKFISPRRVCKWSILGTVRMFFLHSTQ